MIRSRHVVVACLLGASAVAAAQAEFAAQWPLAPDDPSASAYRVELTPEIYARVWSPALRDVVVVDGDGRPVPAAFVAEPAARAAATRRELPWFPLPGDVGNRDGDIAAISEIDADGSLRRVQFRAPGGEAAGAVLVDASALDAPVTALALRWDETQPPFEQAYRVEASDDLRQWRGVNDEVRVLDLRRDAQRLVERRIALPGPVDARYLRLTPLRAATVPLRLQAVEAELAPAQEPVAWHWQVPAPQPADARGALVYRTDGRFPVERIDIALAGNGTGRWTLERRDADDGPWRIVASDHVVFQAGAGADVRRAPPLALSAPVRDRQWRLTPATPSHGAPPTLRLGYRPETLVFVAEGRPPYALQAGSARAARTDAPVAPLLDALRAQHGPAWRPAAAVPGAMTPLAGEAALQPAPQPRDWKTWTLWGVLLLGVLVVGGFALSLLRGRTAA
ncbi:DUF3999 domain-containing protein [Luteimonas sp. FCS-9]|uniref:DUF3999 domain-containing protein n=1 Tax=Luteimonas sp. FCS-9 TaxID=1547516 RepID=UPI00063E875F|nr:DUF3999 domain-containing protein [Luteimonas sp. FCS-9]KLJ00976.1 hypothetical protein WQ56_06945 [Luteimonas sp. FCS-9]